MVKVLVTVICILILLGNLALHSYASTVMQGERPESPIDVITDKTDYYTGDTVKIKGSVPTLENGHEVNVIVKDANGETFTKLRVKPTDDSKFEASFQIPSFDKLFPKGIWTINIGYAIWAAKLEINVSVGEKITNHSVTISNLEFVTSNAGEMRVGDEVTITSQITNNEERNKRIYYIVQIEDMFGATIFLDWFTRTLGSKESAEFSVIWVPESIGEYEVEIFAWDDINAPTPLTPSKIINKTVSR